MIKVKLRNKILIPTDQINEHGTISKEICPRQFSIRRRYTMMRCDYIYYDIKDILITEEGGSLEEEVSLIKNNQLHWKNCWILGIFDYSFYMKDSINEPALVYRNHASISLLEENSKSDWINMNDNFFSEKMSKRLSERVAQASRIKREYHTLDVSINFHFFFQVDNFNIEREKIGESLDHGMIFMNGDSVLVYI